MEFDNVDIEMFLADWTGSTPTSRSPASSFSNPDDGITEAMRQFEEPTSGVTPDQEQDDIMLESPTIMNAALHPGVEGLANIPTYPDPQSPEIIAHSLRWQQYFDKYLSYGVQYEIARLITLDCFDYGDLSTDLLRNLTGSNADAAPKTAAELESIFAKDKRDAIAFAKETPLKSPWKELDAEIEALSNNKFAGLGFSEEMPDWYGGKIDFRGKLRDHSSTNVTEYKIILEKPELGTSCRFSRRLGSQSLLRISIPPDVLTKEDNQLVDFFSRPFVLSGRVFRAFYAKGKHVFLLKTCEGFDGLKISVPQNAARECGLTLLDFLNWHNPFEPNKRQSMTKWSARFALGLSNTVPGLRLAHSDILEEPDIVSRVKSDMTDGCSFINKAGLLQLQLHFQWKSFPTAVQCRLGGTKGLLSLHPDMDRPAQERPTVWIRPSQVKIKYPSSEEPDPARLVIDIVQPSHMKSGRLKSETLINLAENGVPHCVLVKLLQEGLDEHVAGLIQWEGEEAMLNLWCNLAHKGRVMSTRRARQAAGEARARGYDHTRLEDEEGDEDDLEDAADMLGQTSAWIDEFSGNPTSPEETIMAMLDAGFTPKNCVALREKLNKVVTSYISDYVLVYSIQVPMSCTAMLIPDPFGVLGPGEIHIKCSKKIMKTPTEIGVDTIVGDVLLTRYPCKLPTDIQKFKAVEKTELSRFLDVIVCSVQGDRRQADLLAGGDYDGDKGLAIWQPEIVNAFIPADLKHSREPVGVPECFSLDNEYVSDFLKRTESESLTTKIRALHEVLLSGLRDPSIIGKYSGYHDSATYKLGYDHPDTVRLAYMFCKVLDAFKTGLKVLPEVLKKDSDTWKGSTPFWKKTAEEKSNMTEEEADKLCRRGQKPPFIMDTLSKEAPKAGKRKLEEIEKLFSLPNQGLDKHLADPWLNAVKIADRYRAEEKLERRHLDLKKIMNHVESMFAKYENLCGRESTGSSGMRNKLRHLSKEFASKPPPEDLLMDRRDISRLRASYAYYYDATRTDANWSFFPWDVAMRELCSIKANASGSSKTVTMHFYELFTAKGGRS